MLSDLRAQNTLGRMQSPSHYSEIAQRASGASNILESSFMNSSGIIHFNKTEIQRRLGIQFIQLLAISRELNIS